MPARCSPISSEGRISVDVVRERIARRPVASLDLGTSLLAAVSIVLTERMGDAHALLIERAHRRGDPWSGHMAFPGGHRQPDETDLSVTAARETLEEVGVDLFRQSEAVGRLDDIRASGDRPVDMLIRPFVWAAPEEPELRLDPAEVRSAVWIPLSALHEPQSRASHRYRGASFPAFRYAGFTIWGLTYGMLTSLLSALGEDAPTH